MKFLLFAAALAAPALAIPEPVQAEGGVSLNPRALPKLNQYANMDDCHNDRNIISHVAPVSGQCYNLDDNAGAYFYNTGGFLQSYSYSNKGCGGAAYMLQRYTGKCQERNDSKAVKMS